MDPHRFERGQFFFVQQKKTKKTKQLRGWAPTEPTKATTAAERPARHALFAANPSPWAPSSAPFAPFCFCLCLLSPLLAWHSLPVRASADHESSHNRLVLEITASTCHIPHTGHPRSRRRRAGRLHMHFGQPALMLAASTAVHALARCCLLASRAWSQQPHSCGERHDALEIPSLAIQHATPTVLN
jgi:hypothetical protein